MSFIKKLKFVVEWELAFILGSTIVQVVRSFFIEIIKEILKRTK